MPLFDETNKSPNHSSEIAPAAQLSAKLANGLRTNRLGGSHLNSRQWIPFFEDLINKYSIQRVTRVVEWYSTEGLRTGFRISHSGKSFALKFLMIEDAMRRRRSAVSPGDITDLSDAARRILRRLEGRRWPAGIGEQLELLVQASVDNYEQFEAQIHRIQEKYERFYKGPQKTEEQRRGRKLFRLARYIDETHLTGAENFIEHWFAYRHDYVSHFTNWVGSPDSVMFVVNGKLFQWIGGQWCNNYFGETKQWRWLMEEIDSESTKKKRR